MSGPAPELRTRRLTLRPIGAGDSAAIVLLHRDPRMTAQLIDGVPVSLDDAGVMLRLNRPLAERGIGTFAVRRHAVPGVIGFFSLVPFEADPALLEFGGRLMPAAWAGGLSLEAGAALIDHAVAALGQRRLVSAFHPDNRSAQAALALLGFADPQAITHFGHPATAMTLDAARWPSAPYRRRANRSDYGGAPAAMA